MIRGRKKIRNRRALNYKRRARFGIGETIETTKRKKKSHRNDVIHANREAVFNRDAGCRRCFKRGNPRDHCHEVIPRSALRGRPPEDIFNLVNCIRLCAKCHSLITRHVEDIVYVDPERGCIGPVEFQPRLHFGGPP